MNEKIKQVYTDSGCAVTTNYFFGGAYEVRVEGAVTTTLKYYSLGGQSVMRDEEGLKYLLTDDSSTVLSTSLGSVELQRLVSLEWRCADGRRQRASVTDEDGDLLQQTRYLPYACFSRNAV